MIDVLTLPKTSMMKFNGDPLDYNLFMNTFDNIVDIAGVYDASSKLSRLFKYYEGKANSVVRTCALMSPSEGYKRAQLIKDRFGICK